MAKKPQKTAMSSPELLAIYEALDRSQAVIEFDLDGKILAANENFLRIFGYDLDEIVGKHHRIFCDPSYAATDAYTAFWQKLGRGEFEAAEFKRTRSRPNSGIRPLVTPSGPPQASSSPGAPMPPAVSSPITMTVGSRRISCARASLIAWR